ncbi:Transposase [Bacteroidales bacterium Barb6]|nr:Transposase [Bacteroidales bacterium Barb6]
MKKQKPHVTVTAPRQIILKQIKDTDAWKPAVVKSLRKVFQQILKICWKGLQSIIKITATREIGEKVSAEERFCISSLYASQPFNRYIRNHWGAENSLHWTLDTVFGEDEQRKRTRHAAENFAIVRKIALNLLKKDKSKESFRSKRLKAGWNKDYLIQLIKF